MLKNVKAPYRIGVMVDLPGFPGLTDMFPLAVKFALKEAHETGLIDRPAEVIENEHTGQPGATATYPGTLISKWSTNTRCWPSRAP